MDIFVRTRNMEWLQKAYELTVDNINPLINEQKKMNTTYLSPIVLASEPAGASKEQKEEITAYNKLLNDERKTALPPVSEPLILNLELLFALADKLDIDEEERSRLDKMLRWEDERLFISEALESQYRFIDKADIVKGPLTKFTGKTFEIPVSMLSIQSTIRMSVSENDEIIATFDDFKPINVVRTENIVAVMKSENAQKFAFKPNYTITVEVIAHPNGMPVIYVYRTEMKPGFLGIPTLAFSSVA